MSALVPPCGHCTPSSVIALDHEEHKLVFILTHQRGCRAVADLFEMSGVTA